MLLQVIVGLNFGYIIIHCNYMYVYDWLPINYIGNSINIQVQIKNKDVISTHWFISTVLCIPVVYC